MSAGLAASTVTPGSTAPVASRATPAIAPVLFVWAPAIVDTRQIAATSPTNLKVFIIIASTFPCRSHRIEFAMGWQKLTCQLSIVQKSCVIIRAAMRSPSRTLNRTAYEKIRAAIIHGRFDFGEPLSETELAKALGISKGPVRTALRELQVHGLVEIVPQSATYVFRAS